MKTIRKFVKQTSGTAKMPEPTDANDEVDKKAVILIIPDIERKGPSGTVKEIYANLRIEESTLPKDINISKLPDKSLLDNITGKVAPPIIMIASQRC